MKQKYNFRWLDDLRGLVFPRICLSCYTSLNHQEDTLCLACLYKLPKTQFHRISDNPVFFKFAGRIPINAAYAFLLFHKGNVTQDLLHQLKYRDREDIGERLGMLFALDLLADDLDLGDIIVPLPLHPAKQKLRGYNQCDSIARGMASILKVPIAFDAVQRSVANTTQTRKGRFDRWLNVEHIFEINEPKKIRGRHILLLDDVITTGSTLEACGRELLEAGARDISVAAIASA